MALNFPSDTSSPYIDSNSGLKYIYNSAIGAWEAAIQPPVISSATQPNISIEGFLWWDTANSILYVYNNSNWERSTVTPNLSASIGESAPTSPSNGQLWWDSNGGRLYIYYNDTNSSQWIEAVPSLAGTNNNSTFITSTQPPEAIRGDLWFNTVTNPAVLYVYSGGGWAPSQGASSGVDGISNDPSSAIDIIDNTTPSNPKVNVPLSGENSIGVIQIATDAQVIAGADDTKAVSPKKLFDNIASIIPTSSTSTSGTIRTATVAESLVGTSTATAVTPEGLGQALSSITSAGNPAGTIITFAGNVIPTGYLACDGAEISRTTGGGGEDFSGLFTAIGTIYGSGDGSTTFNIPDLRGAFVRGWNGMGGSTPPSTDPGRVLGSSQQSSVINHTHDVLDSSHSHAFPGDSRDDSAPDSLWETRYPNNTFNDFSSVRSFSSVFTDSDFGRVYLTGDANLNDLETDNPNNNGAAESRPYNIALQYLIKY